MTTPKELDELDGPAAPKIHPATLEALFASDLQPSDNPTAAQILAAVCANMVLRGVDGCLCVVAFEFGDHCETACARMRWAHEVLRLHLREMDRLLRAASVSARAVR